MKLLSGLFHSRDKPRNSTSGSSYRFFYVQSSSGICVTERSEMQMTDLLWLSTHKSYTRWGVANALWTFAWPLKCHRQYNGIAKPKREITIDDVISFRIWVLCYNLTSCNNYIFIL